MKKHIIDEFCNFLEIGIRNKSLLAMDVPEVVYNCLADYVDLAEMLISKKIYISCWDYYNDCDLPTKEAKNVKKAIKLMEKIRVQEQLENDFEELLKDNKNDQS